MRKGKLSDILKELPSNLVYNFDAIVNNVSKRTTKTGHIYLDFALVANEVSVTGRRWNADLVDLEQFRQGVLLSLTGKFVEFQDQKQFVVDSFQVLNDEEKYKKILPTAPGYEKMADELKSFLVKIVDPDYRKIVQNILDSKTFKIFCEVRAGLKIHHSVYGGLLWHTVSMLKTAEKLLKIYDYLPVNPSLLYAGIVLHDVGKILEIGDYFQNKYSLEGEFLGHISLGTNWVLTVGKQLSIDSKKVNLLAHLILASHGKLENGSAVEPKVIEAWILFYLDNLDAKLNAIFNCAKGVFNSKDGLTTFYADGKKTNLYLHHLKK